MSRSENDHHPTGITDKIIFQNSEKENLYFETKSSNIVLKKKEIKGDQHKHL